MSDIVFNPKDKPIVLWGGGKKTKCFLKNHYFEFPIAFIVDSDIEKNQSMLCGLNIVSIDFVSQLEEYFVIVIPQKYQEEIFSILSERNMQYGIDYIGISELSDLYKNKYEKQMLDDVSHGYKVMVLPVFPIGDICTIISFLKAYKEKVNQPLSLYAGDIKNRDLLQLCQDTDKVDMLCWDFLLFQQRKDFFKDNDILDLTSIFDVFKGEKHCDSPAEAKVFLGLSEAAECNRIGECTFGSVDNVEGVFRNYKLIKGKTVFLVPHGDWLGKQVVTEEFWSKLCKALEQKGYTVVFNAEKEIVPGVPSVFLDVLDVPLFAKLCGNVVGARTGLLNYIAFFTDVKIQAIWPGKDNSHFKSDYWRKWCEIGGIDLSKKSDYFMEHGLSIRHETGRKQNLIEFIYEQDEKDIAFIIENIEKVVFNPENKPIIIWGAGKRTEQIVKDGLLNFSVEYIVDIDKSKKMFGGIEIISPENINEWKDYYVIVIPKKYRNDIFQVLSKKKLQYGRDYIGYEELCEFLSESYKNRLLADLRRKEIQIILMSEWPIGDMCSLMGFLEAYREKNKKMLVFYIIGKRGKEALELCRHIERVETIPVQCIKYFKDIFYEEKNRIFDLRPIEESPDKLDALKAIRKFLQLTEDTKYDKFALRIFPDERKIVSLFQTFGLRRGKTVFIVPHANWFGPIGKKLKSIGFWTKLCDALSKGGYDVVFNSEEEVVSGVPYVFLQLSELPKFIELCGNVVGIRTGLLNFIAISTEVMIQSLWPENSSPYFETDAWKEFSKYGNLLESDRSKELMEAGLALTRETDRTEKIFEFVCQDDEKDVETIIKNLDMGCETGVTSF